MKAINVLLSVLVSAVLFLLLFEGGLRLLGKLGLGAPATINRFDAALGWSKKPSSELRRNKAEFDITIATNELGLRDDSMASLAKPPGTFRVVVLGDSFTLGYTVDREDLFVDLLEGRWRLEGRNVEVVNAGTEAWSTDQEVRWLMEHGQVLQPDLVVLASYDNDIFWNGQDRYTSWSKPRFEANGSLESDEPLPDHTGGWRRKTKIGRLIFGSGSGSNPRFSTSGGNEVEADFSVLMNDPPDVLGDALERTRGCLLALEAECARLGAKLLVAPIPSHACVDEEMAVAFGRDYLGLQRSEWDPCRPVELFLGWCAELGIEAVDARPALREATLSEDCYLSFFAKDREWHFNPHGNRVFAQFLYDEIDRLGLLAAKQGEADFAALVHRAPEGGIPRWLILYLALLAALTGLYFAHYKDEKFWQPPLKVGGLLAAIFLIFFGATWLVEMIPARSQPKVVLLLIAVILGFVAWKLGRRLLTIGELLRAFVLRGHWYLMPLVVVLLTVGSLLVVAASSPLVAPFIYTLF